jgi:hypothetical protein
MYYKNHALRATITEIAILLAVSVVSSATAAQAQLAPPPPPPAETPPAPLVRIENPRKVEIYTPSKYRHRIRRRPNRAVRYKYRRRCQRCLRRVRHRSKRSKLKAGPYFGISGGSLNFLNAPGPYKYINRGGYLSTYFGYSFRNVLSLALAFNGGILKKRNDQIGELKNPSLLGVTLDFRFRFAEPDRGATLVPYLQTGLGLYFLNGVFKNECGEHENNDKILAQGGGLQLGGGFDYYLNRYITLGVRVLYRPLFMSNLRCGPGARGACLEQDPQGRTTLHGLSAEFNLTLRIPVL